jgi:hypothetical protein
MGTLEDRAIGDDPTVVSAAPDFATGGPQCRIRLIKIGANTVDAKRRDTDYWLCLDYGTNIRAR